MTFQLDGKSAALALPVVFAIGAGLFLVLSIGWLPWELLPVPLLTWLLAAPGLFWPSHLTPLIEPGPDPDIR